MSRTFPDEAGLRRKAAIKAPLGLSCKDLPRTLSKMKVA
jgi:hypothetical protein